MGAVRVHPALPWGRAGYRGLRRSNRRGPWSRGLLLLADLRRLHRVAAGVSLDWELLGQGAQAAKDSELLALTKQCHPQSLRQMRWANAILKVLSPQVLAS